MWTAWICPHQSDVHSGEEGRGGWTGWAGGGVDENQLAGDPGFCGEGVDAGVEGFRGDEGDADGVFDGADQVGNGVDFADAVAAEAEAVVDGVDPGAQGGVRA